MIQRLCRGLKGRVRCSPSAGAGFRCFWKSGERRKCFLVVDQGQVASKVGRLLKKRSVKGKAWKSPMFSKVGCVDRRVFDSLF